MPLKLNRFYPLLTGLTLTGLALAPLGAQTKPETYGTPPAQADKDLQTAVQITEMGCMRALVVLDEAALPEEKLITQRLSDVDFRVFPSAKTVTGRVDIEELKKIGEAAAADLVFYANVTDRLKNSMGDFKIYEGEASVQIYSPVSGELLVTHTSRALGQRNVDEVDAKRSAREKVLDLATKEAITKSLEKAHKLIVYQAIITKITNRTHLLSIKEYLAKLKGVYHVREVTYDAGKGEALLEIIGAPQTATYWRAWLEKLPKTKVTKYVENTNLRKKYPTWFGE